MQGITRVAVCGLGKLGACIAAVLSSSDFGVVGLDTDIRTVTRINQCKAPHQEPGIQELISEYPFHCTTDPKVAVRDSEACFFIVPTPTLPGSDLFDNTYLKKAITAVAEEVKKQEKRNYLFVVNSTTTPQSCHIFLALLNAIVGADLNPMICYKPEFIALGDVIKGLTYPDVVLIGEGSIEAGDALEGIYRRIAPEGLFHRMSLVEAELAKISLNCYITMKISFANQINMVAERFHADGNKILASIGDDKRVGPRCLKPGLPYGGPCFPRDNRMFKAVAKYAPLAEATDKINFEVRERILDKVREHFSPHSTSPTVGILGMAYKPGTALADDSLGTWLQATLLRKGYIVRTHDPLADHTHMLDEVLSCQLIIVACAHPEYADVDIPQYKKIVDPAGILPAKFYKWGKEPVTS